MEIVIIFLRLAHIVSGAIWVGMAVTGAVAIEPAVRAAGPAGGQFMQRFAQGKFTPLVSVTAAVTIVAGFLLYGLRQYTLSSTPGLVFMLGGLIGVGSLLVGMIISMPASRQMSALGAAIAASGKPPTAEQAVQIGQLQARLRRGGQWNAVLGVIALALMSVARFL